MQKVQVSNPVGTREAHAAVLVAAHVGDDRLVQAAERVVPGILAARPRERRVAALHELLRLVAHDFIGGAPACRSPW